MIDPVIEILELKEEVARLKEIVVELTLALKVLTEKDNRSQDFLERVQRISDKMGDQPDN